MAGWGWKGGSCGSEFVCLTHTEASVTGAVADARAPCQASDGCVLQGSLGERMAMCHTKQGSCAEHPGEPGECSGGMAGIGRDRPLASQVWMVL